KSFRCIAGQFLICCKSDYELSGMFSRNVSFAQQSLCFAQDSRLVPLIELGQPGEDVPWVDRFYFALPVVSDPLGDREEQAILLGIHLLRSRARLQPVRHLDLEGTTTKNIV